MIGVSSGTINSRGVRVLNWNRRAASVASGENGFRAARGRGRTASGLMAVIFRSPFGSEFTQPRPGVRR